VTIGSQEKSCFGGKCVVKIDGDTIGLADRYEAQWGYPVAKRPVFGSQIKIRGTQSYDGELRVEGLYSTDNVIASKATPVTGVLPSVTVVVEETDIQSPTPVKKTWTFVGQLPSFQKTGQADQFSIFRMTLDLSAEPVCT